MKKVLIILCLLTFIVTNAKAQTKEETINWLQEKLNKYSYVDVYGHGGEDLTVKVTDCFITINYRYLNSNDKNYYNNYYIIPTTNVELGRFIKMKKNIESIREKFCGNDRLTFYAHISIKSGEENLYERLQKAIDHLATFCPKKTETF